MNTCQTCGKESSGEFCSSFCSDQAGLSKIKRGPDLGTSEERKAAREDISRKELEDLMTETPSGHISNVDLSNQRRDKAIRQGMVPPDRANDPRRKPGV